MKKVLFSILLIGTFATYALYVQQSLQRSASAPIVIVERQDVTTQTPPVQATPTPVVKTPPPKSKGMYQDGTFTGAIVDAYYGNVQVAAVIQGGRITDVQFLDHPQDRSRSIAISEYAMPKLTSEAIQVQSANVDVVSGATATSDAFIQSLGSALAQAKN